MTDRSETRRYQRRQLAAGSSLWQLGTKVVGGVAALMLIALAYYVLVVSGSSGSAAPEGAETIGEWQGSGGERGIEGSPPPERKVLAAQTGDVPNPEVAANPPPPAPWNAEAWQRPPVGESESRTAATPPDLVSPGLGSEGRFGGASPRSDGREPLDERRWDRSAGWGGTAEGDYSGSDWNAPHSTETQREQENGFGRYDQREADVRWAARTDPYAEPPVRSTTDVPNASGEYRNPYADEWADRYSAPSPARARAPWEDLSRPPVDRYPDTGASDRYLPPALAPENPSSRDSYPHSGYPSPSGGAREAGRPTGEPNWYEPGPNYRTGMRDRDAAPLSYASASAAEPGAVRLRGTIENVPLKASHEHTESSVY